MRAKEEEEKRKEVTGKFQVMKLCFSVQVHVQCVCWIIPCVDHLEFILGAIKFLLLNYRDGSLGVF